MMTSITDAASARERTRAEAHGSAPDLRWKNLYTVGGVAALLSVAVVVAAIVARSIATCESQVFLVEGDRGMGKTMLCDALIYRVRDQSSLRILRGQAFESTAAIESDGSSALASGAVMPASGFAPPTPASVVPPVPAVPPSAPATPMASNPGG